MRSKARRASGVVATLLVAACARDAQLASPPAHAVDPPAPRVTSFAFSASDLSREERFFRQLDFLERRATAPLGGDAFSRMVGLPAARARRAALVLGQDILELTAFESPLGRPMPEPTRSNDAWFQHTAIVVRDIDAASAELARNGVMRVSPFPQTIPHENAAAGGIRALYFRDPEGHNLELIWYPPGKGAPRWKGAKGRLFLGLDHTGIVVADTARSVEFYRDQLGLRIAGESFNFGPEQDALSSVHGARVRITTLRGESGAGIELLEYLAPQDGREFPEANAADLVHWESTIEVDDIHAVVGRLRGVGVSFVSDGVVELATLQLGYSSAALVRDPDGHAVRLVAR